MASCCKGNQRQESTIILLYCSSVISTWIVEYSCNDSKVYETQVWQIYWSAKTTKTVAVSTLSYSKHNTIVRSESLDTIVVNVNIVHNRWHLLKHWLYNIWFNKNRQLQVTINIKRITQQVHRCYAESLVVALVCQKKVWVHICMYVHTSSLNKYTYSKNSKMRLV